MRPTRSVNNIGIRWAGHPCGRVEASASFSANRYGQGAWTAVETGVAETDVRILGTDGVAGREMVQAREICDPTPANTSGQRSSTAACCQGRGECW